MTGVQRLSETRTACSLVFSHNTLGLPSNGTTTPHKQDTMNMNSHCRLIEADSWRARAPLARNPPRVSSRIVERSSKLVTTLQQKTAKHLATGNLFDVWRSNLVAVVGH